MRVSARLLPLVLSSFATLAGCGQAMNTKGGDDAGAGDGRGDQNSTSSGDLADDGDDALPSDASPLDASPSDTSENETTSDAATEVAAEDAALPDVPTPDAPMPDAGSTTDAVDDAPTTPVCDGPGARFVTDIVAHQFGAGQSFGQDAFPTNVFGPPLGGGCCAGSLDVVALGDGGTVTVAFGGNTIVDGPGPDFIVFENAFNLGGDPTNPYAEVGIVEVSQDGTTWSPFPCTATAFPYGTCAGWHPVFANGTQNTIDPTDPALAGGDPFDLADVGLTWVRYVRVTDRPGDVPVFDLDAIAIANASCP